MSEALLSAFPRPYLREPPERHSDHRIYFSSVWNWSRIVIYSQTKICKPGCRHRANKTGDKTEGGGT